MVNLRCTETVSSLEWMLNLTGLWPKRTMTKVNYLKVAINWFVSISLMVIILLEAIKQTYDFRVINELTCSAIPYGVYIVKLRAVTLKKKYFLAILDDMESEIFNEHFGIITQPINEAIRTSHALTKLFRVLVFLVIIFYFIFPFFDEKSLPIPFSYDLGHFRFAMHLYQSFALSLTGWNISCMDVLFATLMIVAACQIDILRTKLSSCVSEVEADIRNGIYKLEEFDVMVIRKIRRCIKLHIAIISFVEKIENMFSAAAFVQYTSGMVVICSTLLQLVYLIDPSSIQFPLNIVFLSGILTQFTMYHWFGNDVIYKSSLINNSCYECEWYKCKPSFRKMMFTLMERAKKPIGVTALNFTFVSLTSLGTIFKWSYSLFALLKTKYST